MSATEQNTQDTTTMDTVAQVRPKMSVSERNKRKRLKKRPWAQKAENERMENSSAPKKTEQPKPVAKVPDEQDNVDADGQVPEQADEHVDASDEEQDNFLPRVKDVVRFPHKGSVCHGRVEAFVDPATDKFYQKNGGSKEDPAFYNVKVGQKEWVSICKSDFYPDSGCNVRVCRAVKYLRDDEVVKITYSWHDRGRFVLANQRMVDFADEGKKWVLV